ncbi:50S ribosomal protein L3 [Candidatus Uhrbacteria bacterium]|nr:50S ribosomal protein L3 [Candidatus Uhrbacteria bacterium]
MKFILATKSHMTQTHDETGAVVPLTVLSAGPCVVTQVKTNDKDGYTAIQFGYGERRRISRALKGHTKGLFNGKDGRGFQYLREARVSSANGVERGRMVDVTSFVPGDTIQVTAWSKGRGFTGVVKRHHFHGHPPTHGHKDQERMPGSIGAGGNQHVFKGVRMAGRMGNEQVTVKNLKIVAVDAEKGLLLVHGAVPGSRSGLVIVQGEGEMVLKKIDNGSSEAVLSAEKGSLEKTEESEIKNQESDGAL